MRTPKLVTFILGTMLSLSAQKNPEQVLWDLKQEVYTNSKAMEMLSTLTDVYGPRLTGSREYRKSALWMHQQLESFGLDNVTLESTCEDCRGWSLNRFNVELTSPNYMGIVAYPLAMTKGTKGPVEGEVVHIKRWWDLEHVKEHFTGKLNNKVVLMGYAKKSPDLNQELIKRYADDELTELANRSKPTVNAISYTPELMEQVFESDRDDQAFLTFIEKEGALGVLTTNASIPGILRVEKTFYFLKDDYKPLPVFSIIPEHFGRLSRLVDMGRRAIVGINLDTEFYVEPQNHVNIMAEIKGTDPVLSSEAVLIGGHFDSWHAATGATDNGVNTVIIAEAFRILKKIGYRPKRTIRLGLWSGEEQAFYGSLGYTAKHYGGLWDQPSAASKNTVVYLNLDNGAGLIRGIYLQNNEAAKPIFNKAFEPLRGITEGITTIENQLYTDHVVFDHYNIPAFQFLQDPLAFYSMTLHTNMDVYEYVPETEVLKNTVIVAWMLYFFAENPMEIPRKDKN